MFKTRLSIRPSTLRAAPGVRPLIRRRRDHRRLPPSEDPPTCIGHDRNVVTSKSSVPEPPQTANLLRALVKALDQVAAHALAARGFTPAQFTVLQQLRELPSPTTQSVLAAAIDVAQPTMAATLARMDRDGLIERRPDPEDYRKTLVRPSLSANRRYRAALLAKTQAEQAVRDQLSETDAQQLDQILLRLLATDKETEAPGPDGALTQPG